MSNTNIQLSVLDEARFAVRTARATLNSYDDVLNAIAFCYANHVRLLIVRCPVIDIRVAQMMEQHGALLMDTLVYYTRNLEEPLIFEGNPTVHIRPIREDDIHSIELIARAAFQDYNGHYHADERLDRTACNETYVSWALRSCQDKSLADEVLVAEFAGSRVGFGAIKRTASDITDGRLYAVMPDVKRQGVYRALLQHSLVWSKEQGCSRMLYSTQITNVVAQRICMRLGFEISHAYYTFHKWFDENSL